MYMMLWYRCNVSMSLTADHVTACYLWSVKAVEDLENVFNAVTQGLDSCNCYHRFIQLLVQIWILQDR